MPDFNAVMIIGHFVVSIFQIPLGQPLYQFAPYPTMERCEEYAQYVITPQAGHAMGLEYKLYKTAECITKEEFERQMELFNQQQSGNPNAPAAPKLSENDGGW
jgi:hypothetical protein